jgi:hypothetical protein
MSIYNHNNLVESCCVPLPSYPSHNPTSCTCGFCTSTTLYLCSTSRMYGLFVDALFATVPTCIPPPVSIQSLGLPSPLTIRCCMLKVRMSKLPWLPLYAPRRVFLEPVVLPAAESHLQQCYQC